MKNQGDDAFRTIRSVVPLASAPSRFPNRTASNSHDEKSQKKYFVAELLTERDRNLLFSSHFARDNIYVRAIRPPELQTRIVDFRDLSGTRSDENRIQKHVSVYFNSRGYSITPVRSHARCTIETLVSLTCTDKSSIERKINRGVSCAHVRSSDADYFKLRRYNHRKKKKKKNR